MSEGITKRNIVSIVLLYLVGSTVLPIAALVSAIITVFPAQLWANSKSCPEFYNAYWVVLVGLFIGIICFYFKNLARWLKEKSDIKPLFHKFLFSLYCISNYIILHLILGGEGLCHGDGQSILVIVPAGIISSLTTVPVFCLSHRLMSQSTGGTGTSEG